MARIEWVDTRLRLWAEWRKVGDGSGYAKMSTLHPQWQPPAPGQTPTLKVAAPSGARETEKAVRKLSQRLQWTLALHYCTNLPVAAQCQRLAELEERPQPLVERAVEVRIERAHALLAAELIQ